MNTHSKSNCGNWKLNIISYCYWSQGVWCWNEWSGSYSTLRSTHLRSNCHPIRFETRQFTFLPEGMGTQTPKLKYGCNNKFDLPKLCGEKQISRTKLRKKSCVTTMTNLLSNFSYLPPLHKNYFNCFTSKHIGTNLSTKPIIPLFAAPIHKRIWKISSVITQKLCICHFPLDASLINKYSM